MTNRLTKNIYLAVGFLMITLLVFVAFQFAYNFFAMKDTYMYDDNNKYIDTSLAGAALTADSNLKQTYKQTSRTDAWIISTIAFVSVAKKWFFVVFLGVFLVMVFISKKNGIIPYLRDTLNGVWK